MKALLKSRYALLFVLAGVSFAVYAYGYAREIHWLDSIASNLASGFLASLITVLFIDRALERDRDLKDSRLRRLALSQLQTALYQHIDLLWDWYKAATLTKPAKLPSTLDEMFSEDYFEQIRYLDFDRTGPPIVLPKQTWLGCSATRMRQLQAKFSNVIEKYAGFLGADLLELMEEMGDTPFVTMFETVEMLSPYVVQPSPERRAKEGLLDDPEIIHVVKEHTVLLRKLMASYEVAGAKGIDIADLIRVSDTMPLKYGSDRIATAPS